MSDFKIVHFSSVHRADDPRIFDKECRSLADAGFEVVLIARAEFDHVVAGINIIAFNRPSSGNKLLRLFRTTRKMVGLTLRQQADVYHFHDPELLPVGVMLRFLGKRVIYDAHETTKKQMKTAAWLPKPLRPVMATLVGQAERLAAILFSGIVAATPAIARQFPERKTVTVQNFPSVSRWEQTSNMPYDGREMRLVYVGGIEEKRGAFDMVRAMDVVGEQSGARLSLAGRIPTPHLRARLEAEPGWEHIDEQGWLNRQEVMTLLGKSRVGLVVLHLHPNYLDSFPTKLFEYMLAGIPVVASDIPFWRQFVTEIGAGVMVEPGNPTAIADAVTYLLEHPDEAEEMGQRGRRIVLDRYSWEREEPRLVKLYRKVLDQ